MYKGHPGVGYFDSISLTADSGTTAGYIYDANGNEVYDGILDYCPFKDDFDDYGKWNEKNKNYDLPSGYVLVGK